MFRTIWWFFRFWTSLIALLPKSKKAEKLRKEEKIEERDALVQEVVPKWAKMLMEASGSSVTVYGQDKVPADETVLFVSNHQGNFDIPILLGYIDKPKAFMAKKELENIPLMSKWMKHMECVFMDRENPRKSLVAIKEGIGKLKSGYSMVIFPEGTRSLDGNVGEFKQGALKLATKSKVKVVPVAISGSNNIMKKKSLIVNPSSVTIVISDPLEITEEYLKDTSKLSNDVREIIVRSLEQVKRGM